MLRAMGPSVNKLRVHVLTRSFPFSSGAVGSIERGMRVGPMPILGDNPSTSRLAWKPAVSDEYGPRNGSDSACKSREEKKNALPTYTRKPGLIDGNNIITRGLPPGRLARAAGDTRDPQSPAWGGTIFLFFWNVSRGLDVLGYWRGGNCGFAFSVEYRACGDAIVRFGAVGGEVWDVRDRGPEAWRDGRFRMGTGACGY